MSLQTLILSFKQTSGSDRRTDDRNTYWIFPASTAAVLGASFLMSVFPLYANGFWSFFTTTRAQEQAITLHDSSLPLLQAAVNPDPNPSKGTGEIALSEGSALVPSAGPEGTAVVYKESARSAGEISLYIVREGDSLSDIASMFGVSTNTILWANGLKSASDIHEGDELLILPVSGVQYTIKRGGTLSDVAKLFNADIEEIAVFNGIDPSEPLAAGTKLIVPGGNLAPVATKKSSGTTAKSSGGSAVPTISGYFSNPLPGGRLTQGIHGYNGIDIGAPSGTPVYASAGGTVIVARGGGGYNGGYGNYIVISHANGTQTLYAHLSSLAVSGGTVEQGELIGYVGNTGRSTGYHLHFEVRGAKNPFAR